MGVEIRDSSSQPRGLSLEVEVEVEVNMIKNESKWAE